MTVSDQMHKIRKVIENTKRNKIESIKSAKNSTQSALKARYIIYIEHVAFRNIDVFTYIHIYMHTRAISEKRGHDLQKRWERYMGVF